MSKIKPETIHTDFDAAFAARDIDAILALYEPEAKFINMDGSEARGIAEIRAALEGFFAAAGPNGKMTTVTNYAYESGDLAMLSNTWVLKTTDPDGKPVEMSGKTVEVARRQADGRWLMVLDNPMGAM